MQPEWIIGITSTLIIIIIAILKARGQTRPGLSAQRYIKPNGMLSDEEAIRKQLRRGNKIKAIKLYRVQAGVGLKEAKYAVEMMKQEMHQTKISDSAENDKEIAEIEHMVSTGNKINAIKLYRQQTGVGLREAKDAVERMAPGLKAENTVSSNQSVQGQVDPDELQRLLLAGQKIQAIKYYRETTGVGLKEAKDAVDWLEAQMYQ